MAVIVPSWFDLDYYLSQKVEQMDATQYGKDWLEARGASSWTSSLVQMYINGWPFGEAGQEPLEGDTPREKAYSNFLACNAKFYTVNVGIADINVSGTPLFDVAVYLQNLADYHNSQNPGASAKATVQTELQALLAAKTSAWAYFQEHWAETPQINPSNNFDLSAYIAERARIEGTTSSQIMAAIQSDGVTPIEDFTVWGPAHNMSAAPKPANPTQPELSSGWSIWGKTEENGSDEPAPKPDPSPSYPGGNDDYSPQPKPDPEPEDPYDQNVTPVEMNTDTGEYVGKDGQNTRFEAASGDGEDATLKPTDVITGGENALNTLAVDLSADWIGFDGVENEDGTTSPNVTNVGRIALSHAGGENAGAVKFSAKNISDDAVRYDLDSKGTTNTISLQDLGAKVEEVRISNVDTGGDVKTELAFANDAPEQLKLVLDNVSPAPVNAIESQQQTASDTTSATPAALGLKMEGVENLTVLAGASAASAQAAGDDHTSEREASISVNLGECSDLKTLKVEGSSDIALWGLDATKISSFDASSATGNVTFGIENLTDQIVKGGSGRDMISFDTEAANVTKANWTGIEDVLMRHGGTIDASGVTGLQELWNLSHGENCEIANLKADNFFICGAPTWDVNNYSHVIVNGDIGNLTWTSAERGVGEQYFSTLDSNAKGDFHLNVGNKDMLAEGMGNHFSSYTLPELAGNISVDIANATPGGAGMHITAPKAHSLEINATGTLYLGGDTDLSTVEDVTLNLQAAPAEEAEPNIFGILDHHDSETSLDSVKTINISAPDMQVELGNIGGKSDSVAIKVQDAALFNAKSISGDSIKVDASLSSGVTRIDALQADGNIRFLGGNGDEQDANEEASGDIVTVTRLGADSSSVFDLGGGNDVLVLDLNPDTGDVITANVTFGAGADFLGIDAHDGLLRVNVKDYTAEDELSVVAGNEFDTATVLEFFARFDMTVAEEDVKLFDIPIKGYNTIATGIEYQSNVYLFGPDANFDYQDGLTMTVLDGWTAEDAADINLR